MQFANYTFLAYGFLIVAAAAAFLVWSFKKRRRAWEEFAQRHLLEELFSSLNQKARKVRALLFIQALFFSVIALARPQWGFSWEEVKRQGVDVFIAVDTSKSMLTKDIKPSRLERAKLAVKDLAGRLSGDRVGLIAFAGTAFVQCPLTVDYPGFVLALDSLSGDSIPQGGTSISTAIKEAIKSYPKDSKKYKAMVIITDGEDHEGDALALAGEAAKEGVRIFTVGVGTKEGELIQVADDRGSSEFLKDREGNVIKSRLNEEILQKIALATNGVYVKATPADFGLDFIYKEKISRMEKRELESKTIKHYRERFQVPLALAFLLLLAEPFISERREEKDKRQ